MSTSKDSQGQREYLRVVPEPTAGEEQREHLVDIIFVHGLNPRSKPNFAKATWTHENGNFWPVAQLRKHNRTARILIFSYNSQVAQDANQNGIQTHAENLLDRLSGIRSSRGSGDCDVPIIFVAHSLGGLVVKQALVIAKNNDLYSDLRKATYGLVFFAVPHQGGNGASLGAIAKNIVNSITGDANNDLIESLKSNALFQENQAAFFKHQLEDYQIVSICENRPTKLTKLFGKATALTVVDRKSATLDLAGTREKVLTVDSNHSDVCQFEGDDDKFEPVKRAISKMIDDAIARQKALTAERSRGDLHNHQYVQDFLHSLHFPDIDSRQENIRDAHTKTFQWIFDRSDDGTRPWSNFLKWLKEDQGIYWINGKTGSGKSTLMRYIYEDPRTLKALQVWARKRNIEVFTPKFFFWNPGSDLQKSFVGMLRSFLYQILRSNPAPILSQIKKGPIQTWTESSLLKVLRDLLAQQLTSHRMCFFLDGLDEASSDHDALISFSRELARGGTHKVVLSSRPYPKFEIAFASCATLRLQDLTHADIKKFTMDRFFAHPNGHTINHDNKDIWPGSKFSDFINEIAESSNGVFLWVVIAVKDQMDGLDNEDNLKQLKERLKTLPTELEDLYETLLSRIKKVNREEAAVYLGLSLRSHEPFKTLLDFTLAANSSLDNMLESKQNFPWKGVVDRCTWTRKRVSAICAGLLEVQDYDDLERPLLELNLQEPGFMITQQNIPEVRFLHRTVIDYFQESSLARDFIRENNSNNCHSSLLETKVLLAKVRMLGFGRRPSIHSKVAIPIFIEHLMLLVSCTEYVSGVAQMAIHKYVDRAVSCIEPKEVQRPQESHWCAKIYEWASRDTWLFSECDDPHLVSVVEGYTYNSTGQHMEKRDNSNLMPGQPVDYLGLAVSFGLKLFVQQQISCMPSGLPKSVADYLLHCALGFDDFYTESLTPRIFDIAYTLLRLGANPNSPSSKGIAWATSLNRMHLAKHSWPENRLQMEINEGDKMSYVGVFRTTFQHFLDSGADISGILHLKAFRFTHEFRIDSNHSQALPATRLRHHREGQFYQACTYEIDIEMSVPTLIRYCLGFSIESKKLASNCVDRGARFHSKCVSVATSVVPKMPKMPREKVTDRKIRALTDQESDRFIKAYEKIVMPMRKPALSDKYEIECVVLAIHYELSDWTTNMRFETEPEFETTESDLDEKDTESDLESDAIQPSES